MRLGNGGCDDPADFLDLFFRDGSPTALLIILLLLFAAIAIANLVMTSKDRPIDLGLPHFVLRFVAAIILGIFLLGGSWAYWVPVIIAAAYISKYLFSIPKRKSRLGAKQPSQSKGKNALPKEIAEKMIGRLPAILSPNKPSAWTSLPGLAKEGTKY